MRSWSGALFQCEMLQSLLTGNGVQLLASK
jgi:hypothetical protein